MNILLWIVFGIIVGITIYTIDPTLKRHGIMVSILFGIVGALMGGLFANIFIGRSQDSFSTASFFIAIAGSLLLLFIGKILHRTGHK